MIGVIGCGNMASAIVRGMYAEYKDLNFVTYTPSYIRAERLAQDVQGRAVRTLKDLNDAKTLIIACKPQQFNELAGELKQAVDLTQKHIISIMAAIPIESLKQGLQISAVTRVMPNTPCLYNQGATLILHSDGVSKEQTLSVRKWFEACGKTFILKDEQSFDQATTVTGSGPAYVFEFAKSMTDKLSSWGHEEKVSREMVVQLFKGAASLMESDSDLSLESLINQVTSKGGVTIEAINVYRAQGLKHITSKALDAAYVRSVCLSNELGKTEKD